MKPWMSRGVFWVYQQEILDIWVHLSEHDGFLQVLKGLPVYYKEREIETRRELHMSKVVVFTNLTLGEEDHRRSHALSVNPHILRAESGAISWSQ